MERSFRFSLTDWLIILAALLLAIAYNYPQGYQWDRNFDTKHYSVLSHQADNLFQNEVFDVTSHEDKMKYRLLPPLVAKLSPNIDVAGRMKFILFALGLCGLAAFSLLYRFFHLTLSDGIAAKTIFFVLPFTYFHYAFFGDYMGMFDGFAYLCILIACLDRHLLIRFIAMSAALWTDERSLFAAGMIVLAELALKKTDTISPLKFSRGIIAAVLVYVPFRIALQILVFRQPFSAVQGIGINELGINLQHWDVSLLWIYFAFSGLWLFIPLASARMYREKNLFGFSLFTFVLPAYLFLILMVRDLTRSAAYSLPLILAALYSCEHSRTWKKHARFLSFMALGFALLIGMLWKLSPGLFPDPWSS